MAGASPPDTLDILYFGTLLTAILWSSRHDIRTAILSLAALTAMGLITPFLGSPAPGFVHVVYLAVAVLAFCLSDSDGTKLITVTPPFSVSESLASVGTVLASVGRALFGILRFHAAVLRIIFAAIVFVDRSVVGVIRGALYIVRSTYSVARGGLRIVAVTVRGTLYVAALIRRFVCLVVRKCLWTIALSIRCIWALLAGPVLVTKALTIGPLALLGDTLCFIAVTIPVIFRAIVYAATLAGKSLKAVVYASAVVSISAVAVSKLVFSAASKCMLAISKLASPREPEPARIVRIVLCPDDYALCVRHTRTVTRGAWPLLRGFDAGVLLALVVFNIVRDVLPATSNKVIGSMSNLVAEAYFCPELALSIGVSAVGYYTAAPLALAVLDVQDVSEFVKRSFSLVPGAVSKKTKRAVPVIARRPLGIYAISPRWLEALQTRLYLRSIPCSLFATDYFRIISRQFDIPGALAMAISRPCALAVVKKPVAIRRTWRLVVEFVKDVARVRAISRPHGLAVVKKPLANCNASRLVVEVVNDNGNLPKPSICNASQLVVEIENDKGNSPGITEPTAFIEEMEDDEAPQSPPAISPAVVPLDISFDLALDTHSYAPVITLPGESPFVEAAGDDDVQTVQTPASAAPLVTVDSSPDISVEVIDVILEMDSSSASITLLDASPSMDTLDYDVLKPVQLLDTVAPVVTSELSVEVVGLGLGTLPFDLDFTLVGVPSSVEAVDDDKVKRESSTTTAVIPAPTPVLSVEVIDAALEVPSPVPETTLPEIAPSESIDVMVDDAVKGVVPPAPVTPVASPVSSPDLSVEAVELPLEVHLPIPSVAQLEEEPSVDVVESELSLSIHDAVDLQEPVVPAGASVSLSDICTEDAALKTGATTSLLEASHNDTVDSQQSPAVSACDLSVELANLTLETYPSDTEVTLLDPSACSGTVGDDVVEPEQPPTRDIPVELLELIPETEAYGPADTVPEDACIDVGDHDTVDVTVALKTSLTPVADDDDEPLEPPSDVPLPLCLIVPELVIPRSLALYTSGPIWQPIVEARCVILFRTRATISGAQGFQELVKETRCLLLRVAQTTVEVFARDSHEVSHWAGSALVARNSLSVETQRLLKFLRLVYGVTAKRQRKRHPRARGGKRIQEAKVRKATKEAVRLARIAEEESHGGEEEETRTAEEASCTVEEEAVCLSEDGRSGTLEEEVEDPIEEATRTTEDDGMRTEGEAAGPVEEATQDTGAPLSSQKGEPCGDFPESAINIVVEDTTEALGSSGSQPAVPSRRRRRRNRTTTSTDKPSDSPNIPSTSMEEEGAGVARIVEDALDEAAGSSGTAPPRAGSRRSRRRRTATT
ncbi:hypothetical protein FOMPIDRAFT_157475 [Fomitopsis schrenkii]|uniref:Uncharacterized protein n=1 Tax=Fomitopsis schrenkii TaxID=2126942 RepID=S8F492_FOMSC|nr:hypothetical protein FOMPIDRAFT_157475 [Fomitopsis schrenkii]